MSELSEEEFEAEFNRLVEKYERCPVCNEPPIKLGSTRGRDTADVEDEEFVLVAHCNNNHMYSVERRFDIE